MGVPGLMSYVTQRSKHFSKEIELHNTKLVIDGYCIAFQLYQVNQCNYCFGGDYGEYAYYVSEFFDELLKCNITPLLVFDGGLEDKKFNTILTRSQERLLRASYSTAANEQELLPLLTKDVLRYIAQQKKIKMVQSSFEADDQIASIARILKCPVLSNDSDFYIFDFKYIPFDSLKNGIFKSTNAHGFVKHCRVYTNDDFINNFPGIDKIHLPLAAALLGNDYIDGNIFNNFFSSIQTPNDFRENHPKIKSHARIEILLTWLQHRSIEQALTTVLDTLDPEKRESTLEIIIMVINGYLVPSSEMLIPLGYKSKEINELMGNLDWKPYEFDQTQFLKLSEEKKSNRKICMHSTSVDQDMINRLSLNDYSIINPSDKSQVNKSIPSWFLYEYNAVNFPGYFMDMLHRQTIVASEQMENQGYPACVFISLKIIRVIFKLLSSGTTNSKMLQYIARGKGANVTTYQLDCNDDFFKDQEFPALEKLTELSEVKRKQILNLTLGVSDQLIMEFPPSWRLYIAVIKYWYANAEKIFVTKWHLYSVMLMIIYHVVKKVILFGSYFPKSSTAISKNQVYEQGSQFQFLVNMPVKDALEKVRKTDCIKAEGFLTLFKSKNQENFNITIVHAFSLLQNCLRYSMHLNALLGHPYPNANVAEFFSGTMLYNFYRDLKKYNKLNEKISAIFENSQTILQLFISMSTKIQGVLEK